MDMLAGILSCFKGCDGHPKGRSSRIETTGSRRDLAPAAPASSQNPGAPCTISCCSDATATLDALPSVCQRCLLAGTTGSSSTLTLNTQSESQTQKDSVVPPVTALGAESELRSYCSPAGAVTSSGLPAISTLPRGGSSTAAPTPATDTPSRSPTPPMLFALRNLHMALLPTDCSATQQQQSPFTTDSPCADLRPSSLDFLGLGLGGGFGGLGGGGVFGGGDLTASDSSDPLSVSGLNPQLRFVNACRLGEEVQDLQLLGRGGYGMVMTGNWRQEGRVAVKVLLSEEDKWVESCYKEAVLSKMLAHPNILQTYDFQVAVLTPADVARARASWELQQQQALHRAAAAQAAEARDPLACSATKLPYADLRADSFELLPTLCTAIASGGAADSAGADRAAGVSPTSIDLWQVLFMLGARPGQFVTLIIMEYAEVGTLQRAIAAGAFRESARLSRWAALRSLLVTAKEVAGGMCLLHSYKIIHGDISATNVMLRASRIDKRGFVAKVADFGLSKVTLAGVARADDWAGQAQYLAPECLLDYEARLASDVFAFGVLLYEMATGRRAFAELQPAQILAGRLAGDLQLAWPTAAGAAAAAAAEGGAGSGDRLRAGGGVGGGVGVEVAPGIRALAERCMRSDPAERPSFREVVDDLRRQDAEAKAQHRQHSAHRRFTADGLAATAAAAAAANASGSPGAGAPTSAAAAGPGGVGVGVSCRVPSLLGPHRFAMGQHGGLAAATAVSPAAAAAAAMAAARVSALVATANGHNGANGSNGNGSPVCPPRPPYGVSTAGLVCGGHSPLRHSFTTGSTGLAVGGGGGSGGACGGGGVRRATATTTTAATDGGGGAAATAGTLPLVPVVVTGDGLSEFTATAALQSESSRTLGYCHSQQSEEGSGKLCTAQSTAAYGDTSLLSYTCDKGSALEPIPSGVMFDFTDRTCAGAALPPPPQLD